MKSLVIVESPAKAKTIEKYLGRKFTVKASMGHLVDLPKSQFGVDVQNGFKPKYINIRGKGKLIKELKEAAAKANAVYLATDPDREGEAISWHLANTLAVKDKPIHRIEFNEITKKAVEDSLKHPRSIDIDRVNAQQARRILDRIVGYELSPLLWKKVRRGLSAGRVQSVAVRMICDREREIQEFVPVEYWSIEGDFLSSHQEPFKAKLHSKAGQKLEIGKAEIAEEIVRVLKTAAYRIETVKKKERLRYPAAPFTTSSLQQEAARKLGFGARKTMMIAQQLYEGIELGPEGSDGLITYMRTDSVRIAQEAQAAAREVIAEKFGTAYLPKTTPVYKTKTTAAQEAHEAIRPTRVDRHPSEIKAFLSRDQYRLYQLIWSRFIASQMTPAVINVVTVDIMSLDYLFRATGSTIKFTGFLEVYQEGKDEEEGDQEGQLPELTEGETVQLKKLEPKQHFTQPPPRYTEASLIKTLEEKGIGRPSTYAPTIDTILKRNYVSLEEKRFHPTELGQVVVALLTQEFSQIVDYDFTADLEEKLDRIAEGSVNWIQVLEQFYNPFNQELQEALEKVEKVELAPEESDQICEKCGRTMVYKYGRFGKFLACPGYPECKNAKPLRKEWDLLCPKCGEGKIAERKTKRGRLFFGCNRYPECDFASWERPFKEPCPKCGAMSVAKGAKGEPQVVTCLNEQCKHRYIIESPEESGGNP